MSNFAFNFRPENATVKGLIFVKVTIDKVMNISDKVVFYSIKDRKHFHTLAEMSKDDSPKTTICIILVINQGLK